MMPSYGNHMHVCLSERVTPKLEYNLQPPSYLNKSLSHLTDRRTYLSIPVSKVWPSSVSNIIGVTNLCSGSLLRIHHPKQLAKQQFRGAAAAGRPFSGKLMHARLCPDRVCKGDSRGYPSQIVWKLAGFHIEGEVSASWLPRANALCIIPLPTKGVHSAN